MSKNTPPPPPPPPIPAALDDDEAILAAMARNAAPPPPPVPVDTVKIERTTVSSPLGGSAQAAANERPVTIGRTIHVTDSETRKVHPAIVTHVNDDVQSIVATVFKPNETVVGVGFLRSPIGLASPGCWHWPT